MSNKLKAYSVQGDEYGCIRFAASNVVARREGAVELDTEFNSVTCRRAPALDIYADQRRVPWKVLVEEQGWSQECGYCQHRVYNDMPGRVWSEDKEQAFCSVECEARYMDRQRTYALQRQQEAQAIARAEDAAYERFPGITAAQGYVNHNKVVSVSFAFPGSTGRATWLAGSEFVNVDQANIGAWIAYSEQYRAKEAL